MGRSKFCQSNRVWLREGKSSKYPWISHHYPILPSSHFSKLFRIWAPKPMDPPDQWGMPEHSPAEVIQVHQNLSLEWKWCAGASSFIIPRCWCSKPICTYIYIYIYIVYIIYLYYIYIHILYLYCESQASSHVLEVIPSWNQGVLPETSCCRSLWAGGRD